MTQHKSNSGPAPKIRDRAHRWMVHLLAKYTGEQRELADEMGIDPSRFSTIKTDRRRMNSNEVVKIQAHVGMARFAKEPPN